MDPSRKTLLLKRKGKWKKENGRYRKGGSYERGPSAELGINGDGAADSLGMVAWGRYFVK